MKKILRRFEIQQLFLMIILAYGLPQLGDWLDWYGVTPIVWIFFILNGGYALYFGWQIRKHGLSPLWLVVQPLIFALLTTLLLNLVSNQYGYYFSLFYLILSLFTFLRDTRDDPDENFVSVENGFHDLGN